MLISTHLPPSAVKKRKYVKVAVNVVSVVISDSVTISGCQSINSAELFA